jgi:hypothetical protein
MTQALYAHMNNKKINKNIPFKKKEIVVEIYNRVLLKYKKNEIVSLAGKLIELENKPDYER